MCTYCVLRKAAIDRSRVRLFGRDAVLKVFETTPSAGDAEIGEFERYWRGARVEATTNRVATSNGEWQFEIWADEEWDTTEAYMRKATALSVGDRRWKITKVEEPIGESTVWRIKAETQR